MKEKSLSGKKLLIANRGEIAIRVARACAELGIISVAIHPEDDRSAAHVTAANESLLIPGRGALAYLDIDAVVDAARSADCDFVHPGYGFLSENATFARQCEEAGITFVGPLPDSLARLGDKARARALAVSLAVPVVEGLEAVTSTEDALAFFTSQPAGTAVMVKAVSGGGGRGIRTVRQAEDLDAAIKSCRAEAKSAFGDDALYMERLIERARHIEVQVLGDGQGGIVHLWNRECTVQRRNQKLLEIAPSPWVPEALTQAMQEDAVRMAAAVNYRGLATVEYLVDEDRGDYAFIEVNPRIQVEHTVTEEIMDIDLVAAQIRVCAGETLADLGLSQDSLPAPRGFAVQARVNAEIMSEDGMARIADGTITSYEVPTGPGLRIDGSGYAGLTLSPFYDSLLAKVIVRGHDWASLRQRLDRALSDFLIAGVETNIGFLRKLLALDEVDTGAVTTRMVDDRVAELVRAPAPAQSHRGVSDSPVATAPTGAEVGDGLAGIAAPMGGVLVSLLVEEGEPVALGTPVAVLEAMKMEHVVTADVAGHVRRLACAGEVVSTGDALVVVEPGEIAG
ncbi:MAG: ATP-grasp domain-containing protein, partial [Rhodobacteraceae bacterium]|nr:ATP-grasp domain-containing protein [Paracoccaceae bacterium]